MIIIHGLNNKGKLQVISLGCWKDRIRDLSKTFSTINYSHIYRDCNKEIDILSNQTLLMQEGKITYHHWEDGNEDPTLYLNLFDVSLFFEVGILWREGGWTVGESRREQEDEPEI